jgi:CHASE3 domain sensor protein
MAWFTRLSVGAKLFAAFMSLLVLMALMGGVSIWKLSALNSYCNEVATNWMPATNAAQGFNTNTSDVRIKELRHILSTTDEDMTRFEGERAAILKDMEKNRDEMIRLVASPEEKQLVDQILSTWDEYLAEADAIIALSRQNKNDEARARIAGRSQQLFNQASDLCLKQVQLNVEGGKREVVAAGAAYIAGRNVTVAVLGVNILLGLGMAVWISRWFTGAIVQVDQIATGVAAASQQLAAASEQLSSGAQQSASSLEETASSLEEMTATVRQNADNADQANQLANSSRETAEKGGAVVANAVRAMGEINQASRKIADIITTIDEIAFQTNLLALNAAVEAARAGEQGRGFAVVAGEVRNLAQRSATAAKEIKGLIEDSVSKVETGSQLVNQSGETLEAIVNSVKRVTDIVGEIAAASREQSAGIDQINKAVAQMDQVTQANASQTEEMSGTAVSLSGQAEQLQGVVAQFNLKKGESHTAANKAPAQATVVERKPSRRSVSRSIAPSRPAKSQSKHELELVGATSSTHEGFEEF